jgi:hypothetical protein
MQGRLSPQLLDSSHFLKTLVQIQENLPIHLALINPPSSITLPNFYKSTRVTIVRTKSVLRFILELPLKNLDLKFTVYEVNPWPHMSSDGHWKLYITDTPYLAVSADSLLFIKLSYGYMTNCRAGSPQFCPDTFPMLGRNAPSCAIQVFKDPASNLDEVCSYNIIKSGAPKFLYEASEKWLYAVPTPLRFSIDCRCNGALRETKWMEISGEGRLILPPGCTAQHENYILHSSTCLQYQGHQRLEIRTDPFNPAIYLNDFNTSASPTTHPEAHFHNLTYDNTSLAFLEKDLIDLDTSENSTTSISHNVLLGTSTSGSLVMLLLIGAVVCLYWRSKQTSRPSAAPENCSTNVVNLSLAAPVVVPVMIEPPRCPRDN